MEPIKEVPLKGLGESELDREKLRVDSRDERKHTGRTDLLQHYMENRQNRQTDRQWWIHRGGNKRARRNIS